MKGHDVRMHMFIAESQCPWVTTVSGEIIRHPLLFNIFSINSKTIVYTGLEFAKS